MPEPQPGFLAQLKSYPATFWVANTMEIFERMSWYGFFAVSSLYITGPVETGALGFTSEQRGQIQAIVPFFLYLMPVLTGALADRYGYKKMFIIAYLGMIASYYSLGQFKTVPTFLVAFMCVAVAAAIFKPVVVGTVARVTNESNSSTAFGIFYMMVNIGGFLGPIIAGLVRGWDWKWVFVACSGWASFNLLIVTLFYKDPSTEVGSKGARTLRKVLDDTVEVLGNLRFFMTVFVVLIALMVANQEFDWFKWWPHCALFVPIWIAANLLWDALWPAGSGRPGYAGGVRRNPLFKRMHCSNWRFAVFLLILSGFWTSFNQIFLTMPEYIRDFSETKPLVDAARNALTTIGKPQWADGLASVEETELLAEVDYLVRRARGMKSAVPPEEEKDPGKLASKLRSKLKDLRKEAKDLASSRFLDDARRERARQIGRELASVDRHDIAAMKAAKKEFADAMDELGRAARLRALDMDPSFNTDVRARIAELLKGINVAHAATPLEVLDVVDGTRKVLAYKVRLRPVEFAELLLRVPTQATLPSEKTLDYAVEQINKRLRNVHSPQFEGPEVGVLKAELRTLLQEHGPIVSREAAAATSRRLTSDERKVEPKQFAAALNALAYKDAIWDYVDSGRQFNPEFIINIDALGIVLFQVLISFLMARFHRFTTMIAGMVVAALGIGLSAFAGDHGMLGPGGMGFLVAAGILVFAFGEMMASPTSQEYVGRIAPEDKKALYMGYYFVAVALGNLFGGILSGQLYGKLARDMQRPDLMWLCFGGIMLATAVTFLLYNKFALPKHAAHTLTAK